MKNKLTWAAYSSKPRIEIIENIKDIISKNDGYIMNFNMFSDLDQYLAMCKITYKLHHTIE